MKLLALITVSFLAISSSVAEDVSRERRGPPKRPNLTAEQESCLKEKLGVPAEKPREESRKERIRPDRAKMEEAFNACNIPRPSHAPRE